jgi:hypothetical protein
MAPQPASIKATVVHPTRPAPAQQATQPAQFRVLQSRGAPAQRSLFAGPLR